VANRVSNVVNNNISVIVQRSLGYTIGAGLVQTPTYAAPVYGFAQVQALDNSELKHLDDLNIQSEIRAVIFRGDLAGVIRPDSKGGDLVTIGLETWLTVRVLEHWPLWTRVAICRQGRGDGT